MTNKTQNPISWENAFDKKPLLLFLVFFTAFTGVFYNNLSVSFLADDYAWLTLHTLHDLYSSFYSSWGHGTAYRPMSRVSFYFDYLSFGADPFGWHLINYLLHSANATLTYLIIVLLFQSHRLALVTATLFLFSPWGGENVFWISGRTHLLGYFFGAFSVYLFLSSRESNQQHKLHNLAFSVLSFLFALLSYEGAAPFFFLLIFLLFLPGKKESKAWKFKMFVSYTLALLVYLALRVNALGWRIGETNNHTQSLEKIWGNFTTIFDITFLQYHLPTQWLLAVLVAGVIVYVGYKKDYQKFVLLLVVSMLSLAFYAPYMTVDGFTYRFFYSSQVFIFLAIGQLLQPLAISAKNLFLLSYLALLSSQLNALTSQANNWSAASAVSLKVLHGFQQHGIGEKNKNHVLVCGVPEYLNNVPLLKGYLPVALYFYTGVDHQLIHNFPVCQEDNIPKGVSLVYFEYDHGSKTIHQTSFAALDRAIRKQEVLFDTALPLLQASQGRGWLDKVEVVGEKINISGWHLDLQDTQSTLAIAGSSSLVMSKSATWHIEERPDLLPFKGPASLKTGFRAQLEYTSEFEAKRASSKLCVTVYTASGTLVPIAGNLNHCHHVKP